MEIELEMEVVEGGRGGSETLVLDWGNGVSLDFSRSRGRKVSVTKCALMRN